MIPGITLVKIWQYALESVPPCNFGIDFFGVCMKIPVAYSSWVSRRKLSVPEMTSSRLRGDEFTHKAPSLRGAKWSLLRVHFSVSTSRRATFRTQSSCSTTTLWSATTFRKCNNFSERSNFSENNNLLELTFQRTHFPELTSQIAHFSDSIQS